MEHIHANEVILVFGYSRTVLHFLRRAAEKRAFEVVVTEGSPTYAGQAMAAELASLGIHATLIADSAVFAMMARVNKVGWRGWGGMEAGMRGWGAGLAFGLVGAGGGTRVGPGRAGQG